MGSNFLHQPLLRLVIKTQIQQGFVIEAKTSRAISPRQVDNTQYSTQKQEKINCLFFKMTQFYVLLILLVILLGDVDGATCPLDWKQDTEGEKCYKLFSTKKTWNEAKYACGEKQAKLAELKDFKSNDFIRTQVGIKAWIGSYRCRNGVTCFLNNDYVPYTPYASDEPDMRSEQQSTNQTTTDLNENDFAILIQKDGKWADELKNNTYPYICEMHVVQESCAALYKSGERKNGHYTIDPDGLGSFQVWCDMKIEGGGWTVFQRRQDASVDFYRGWSDYKAGFGDLNGNFWLGLDKIHRLTKFGQSVLRVDLMDFDNTTTYALYGTFSVASESESYKLEVGNFSVGILANKSQGPGSIQHRGGKCIHVFWGGFTPIEGQRLVVHENCGMGRLEFQLMPDGQLMHTGHSMCVKPIGEETDGAKVGVFSTCDATDTWGWTAKGSLQFKKKMCLKPATGNLKPGDDVDLVLDSNCDSLQNFFKFVPSSAGDSLRYHNGMKFTTRDRDNDESDNKNCAVRHIGGWWYKDCQRSNLNGLYQKKGGRSYAGINWYRWQNDERSMKKADMKLRPVDYIYL